MKPFVAIVGKPNVGKSTFFNKVSGSRISIVLDTPGVTRDRIYADASWQGHEFTLIDTGGITPTSTDNFQTEVLRQAQIAMDLCDVILFFVDGKEGLTADDFDIAAKLRRTKKPVILAVNKIDEFKNVDISDFYALALGDPIPISSEQKKGLGDLLDVVVGHFKAVEDAQKAADDAAGEEAIKIAVVGRPNVGKSSLVNKLLGTERSIVSDVAGTTRDALDTPITVDGQEFVLIDTAGIRRKRSVEFATVEQYSVLRALAAVRRADVCLILLDASEEISEQDVRIAGYVHEQGKPSVVLLNKWDLIERDTKTIEFYNKKLQSDLAFMDYFVSCTISAETGLRVPKIWEMVRLVHKNAAFRATTGLLNDVVTDAVASLEPPLRHGKRVKIRYATQVSSNPPTFVFFATNPEILHYSYIRYLQNCLRRAFDLKGTPIKLIVRASEEKK